MRPTRLLERILAGNVGNVDFTDLITLLEALGFREVGGRGSHRVFARPGIEEFINLQEEKGQAKRYQVRQVATLARRYHLRVEENR
ncbi:MAG: type II toxin-antitoxin system HicA family toxin [Streptosporangiaceae bacterium]